MSFQTRPMLLLPAIFSLIGVLFSLWNLWGDSATLCVTQGCSLFQDFTVMGLSLWWLGLAGFGALLVLAVLGRAALGRYMAGAGLCLDCLLLLVMLVTAPCFNCLIIGLLLALTYAVFRTDQAGPRRQRAPLPWSALLLVWGLLFLVNAGAMARAMVGPWPLNLPVASAMSAAPYSGQYASRAGVGAPSAPLNEDNLAAMTEPQHAPVQIYFSPSCSACRTLVESFTARQEQHAAAPWGAAWYPVAEDSRDIWIIADMLGRMRVGADLDTALKAALVAAPEQVPAQALASPSMLVLQFRLWRNKAHVLGAGANRLPFVEFRGAPAVLMQGASSKVTPQSARPQTGAARGDANSMAHGVGSIAGAMSGAESEPVGGMPDVPFFGVTGFCDGTEACEDPALGGPVSVGKP